MHVCVWCVYYVCMSMYVRVSVVELLPSAASTLSQTLLNLFLYTAALRVNSLQMELWMRDFP